MTRRYCGGRWECAASWRCSDDVAVGLEGVDIFMKHLGTRCAPFYGQRTGVQPYEVCANSYQNIATFSAMCGPNDEPTQEGANHAGAPSSKRFLPR